MMKIAVIDITGRNASQYNPALCRAISKQGKGLKVTLCSTRLAEAAEGFRWLKLISLLPKKKATSPGTGKMRKILRGMEASLNYFYLAVWAFVTRPDIIHFQWLPFIEYSKIEFFFLELLHLASPKSRMYLTAHNVFPHGLNVNQKDYYRKRFSSLNKYMTGYLVHLKSSKNELSSEFGIPQERITVAYHGIYTHGDIVCNDKSDDKEQIKVIMYGNQTFYKGADILVEAIGLLPQDYQNRIKCSIIGFTEPQLFRKCQGEAERLHVEWINHYVSNEVLYDAIGKSDLILLPYRAISQSGVLLLALSYKKPILTSDLPSFKETLEDYPDDYFFEHNNSQSLANKLIEFVDGKLDQAQMINVIEGLNEKYSWDETAKRTIEAYGVSI